MSELTAYNALGRGLNMSGLTDGFGVFWNDNSVFVEYLGALDDYTVAFSIAGSPPVSYMTVSGFVYLNGDVEIWDIEYYNSQINPVLTWADAYVWMNIYDDFSFGTIVSILNGPDTISGNRYNDVIKAGFGNDLIYGNDGNDQLYGEGNNDILFGGNGNDLLDGGIGADIANGGAGNDSIFWGSGDAVNGGTGTDTLRLTSGNLSLVPLSNKVLEVEQIDLRGGSKSLLTLNRADVLEMSSATNNIKIFGDAGDKVDVSGSFTRGSISGQFRTYNLGGGALLTVETDVQVI
jgi:Ca2+-binding RTX toxin-like protein